MMRSQDQPPKIYHFFISRDEPRLRAGWRLLIHVLLLIFLTMISAFIVFIGLTIFGAQISAIDEGLPRYAEILITLPSTLAATFIARSVLDHRTIQSMGLNIHRRMVLDLMVGFIIPLFLIGLIFLLEWGFGWLQIETTSWQASPNPDWVIGLLGSLGYFIVIGVQEELIFRGYQLHNLIEGLDLTKGLILSSAFFALAHLFNPYTSILSTLGLFISGLFLAYGWVRTRQLWLPIGLHIGWNFFEGVIFGFPVSGTDTFRLISHSVSGPMLMTGGEFGPEAGLVLLPALVVGFGLIWIYTKSRVSTQEESSLADSLFGPHIHG
jgi:membrane protease YdiL (CAAX protease family)